MRTKNPFLIATGVAFLSFALGRVYAAQTEHVAELYRDRYGMPHVYAEREEDGFYGVGYAIGQDRLREVLTWYVAVRGELAATFGPQTPAPSATSEPGIGPVQNGFADAIANDTDARRYRLLEVARQNFPRLPSQLQKDIRAYVDGLEAFMRDHPDQKPAWAPPLEPALPLAVLDRLVMEQRGTCKERRKEDRRVASAVIPDAVAAERTLAASNAWVVAGARTADGGVILESDSHGPVQLYGSAFYPFRIKAGTLDFYAVTIVGSPTFLFGHSPHFAWGYTEGPREPSDCYRVKVDPKNPIAYSYDGIVKRMVTHPYRIQVRGQKPIRGSFEYTYHNGVLSPVEMREGDTAYVSSYASADRIGMSTLEYYNMARAHDLHELEAALAEEDGYPANLLIGGADGTVMYIRPGRIPIRAAGVDFRRTLDGNTAATAWQGIHSYAQALKLINPTQGYVGNTNVSPDMMFPDSPLKATDYPKYFGFYLGDTNSRQQRLIELLERASNLTVSGAQAIAMDETPPGSRFWGASFARLLAVDDKVFAGQPDEIREFVAELGRFDGALSRDSRAALYQSELRQVLFDHHREDTNHLLGAIAGGIPLSEPEERILLKVVEETRAKLIVEFGRTDLTWGDVHRIGRGGVDLPVGGGRIIVGTERDARAGDISQPQGVSPVYAWTLRAIRFSVDPNTHIEHFTGGQRVPFLVHFGPHGVESYAQMLWGMSDEPTSAHYSDQASLAGDKTLRRIPLTLEALMSESAALTTLAIADSKRR
jgi:acyl-homoserine-lactone acylase